MNKLRIALFIAWLGLMALCMEPVHAASHEGKERTVEITYSCGGTQPDDACWMQVGAGPGHAQTYSEVQWAIQYFLRTSDQVTITHNWG